MDEPVVPVEQVAQQSQSQPTQEPVKQDVKPVPQAVVPVQHKPVQVPVQQTSHEDKPTLLTRAKSLILEYKRVLHVTKKPDKMEFREIVKVSGLGILVIGLIGYLITIIKETLITLV